MLPRVTSGFLSGGLVTALVVLLALPASAALITWNGGGQTTNWSEAANWTGNVVPGAGDVATFDGTSTKNATIDVSVNVAGIDIRLGYTGTITKAAGVTVTVGASHYTQAAGTFAATGGTITVTGNWTVSGGTFAAGTSTVLFCWK